jgi:uncharacterized coiled-coil DUF342 family protein
MKKLFSLFLVLAFPVFMHAAADPLIRDFLVFEKDFVNLLVLTKGSDYAKMDPLMKNLTVSFNQIVIKYQADPSKDKEWKKDLLKVQAGLKESSALLAKKEAGKLHGKLEHIREALRETRIRNGIVYLPDQITEYHEVMEKLVEQSGKYNPAEAEKMNRKIARAEKILNELAQTAPDPELYPAITAGIKDYQDKINASLKILSDLKTSVQSADIEAVRKNAPALKPVYMSLFKMFSL